MPVVVGGRRHLPARRLVLMLLSALALLAASLAPVGATHEEQPASGLELLGHHELLGTGFNTDVWPHVTTDDRLFAYVGTWGTLALDGSDDCPSTTDNPQSPRKSGVKVVDATDPASPELVTVLGTVPGAQNNDVKIFRVGVGEQARDLLVHSLEPCGSLLLAQALGGAETAPVPLPQTGFQLYDVTEPTEPVRLGTYNNGGVGVHNLYPFTRPDLGGRAFVAAVHNEYNANVPGGVRGELHLVEVTDPASPALVGTWELADAQAPCEPRGVDSTFCFLHDVWVSGDGATAYLSYWDAGLVVLDISDPAAPALKGQGLDQLGWMAEGVEGNTHAAVPMTVGDRELVVVGDEDFTGPGPKPYVTVTEAAPDAAVQPGEHLLASDMSDTPPVAEQPAGPAPALLSDDEFGCSYAGAQAAAGGQEWIAVARRGGEPCATFAQKVAAAQAFGASGLVIVNNGPGSTAGTATGGIPAVMIPGGVDESGQPREGERLIASIDMTAPSLRISLEALSLGDSVDPWGFLRFVDASDPDPANWTEVGTFRAPHVDSTQQPEGTFTAHNPVVGPDGRLYVSWYTNGVRVLEADDSGAFHEVAWYAPPVQHHQEAAAAEASAGTAFTTAHPDRDPLAAALAGGHDDRGYWGSLPVLHPVTGELLVLNSDIGRGLDILRLTLDDGAAGRLPCAERTPRCPDLPEQAAQRRP